MLKRNQESQAQADELFRDQVLRLIVALRDSDVAAVEEVIREGLDTELCGEGLHNQLAFVMICLLHHGRFSGVCISAKEIEDKIRICELLILNASRVSQFTDSALVRAVTQFAPGTKVSTIMGPLKREAFSIASEKVAAPKQVTAFEPEFLAVIQRIRQAYHTQKKALTEKSDQAYQDFLEEMDTEAEEKEEKKQNKKQKKKNKSTSQPKGNHTQDVPPSSRAEQGISELGKEHGSVDPSSQAPRDDGGAVTAGNEEETFGTRDSQTTATTTSTSNPEDSVSKSSVNAPELVLETSVIAATPVISTTSNPDKRVSNPTIDTHELALATSAIHKASSVSTTPASSTTSSLSGTPLSTPSSTRVSSPTPEVEEVVAPGQLGLFATKPSGVQEKYYTIRGCHLDSHDTLYPFFFPAVKVMLSQEAYGDQIVGLQFLTHPVASGDSLSVSVKLPNEIQGLYFDEWVEIDGKKLPSELYRPINFSLSINNLENYFNSGLFFYHSALQACQASHLEVGRYKTLLLQAVFDLTFSRTQGIGFYRQPAMYYNQPANTMEQNLVSTLYQLAYVDLYQGFLAKLNTAHRQQFCQAFTPAPVAKPTELNI